MTASNTDWSLFNDVPEIAKCGAVELYERLVKPSGAALVVAPSGQGKIALCAIDYLPQSDSYVHFWRQLLSNIGVRLQDVRQRWLLPTAIASDTGYVWRYSTTSPPPANWYATGFDDSSWKNGHAGFGDDVPNSKPRTVWTDTPGDIYLRTHFTAAAGDRDSLNMMVHHDEDIEVYVNGTQIYHESGFIAQYKLVELSADARQAFHVGDNEVAVHCRQTAGGQYVDVGFVTGAAIQPSTKAAGHDLLLNGPQN